jgi:Zn-dependent protease with chaperone function
MQPSRRPQFAASLAAVVASCLLAPAALPAVPAENPKLEIKQAKLYQQSSEAAYRALGFYGRLDRPQDLARVLDIGYRLAAASGYEEFPLSFYLVDMPVPNAFALPGGQVFVTRGMLDLELTDDMLACLLGHEIAHVVERHGQRIQRRATLLNLLSQAALIGMMVGADGSSMPNVNNPYGETDAERKGNLIQGTMAAGIVFTELLLRKYSREFEDEADVEGQRMAAAAGFDPSGAQKLWQKMLEKIPQSENYGYWRTHPFSDSRQRAAAARAAELKPQTPHGADPYRQAVQSAILIFRKNAKDPFAEAAAEAAQRNERAAAGAALPPTDDGFLAFLERSALDAWPRGPAADELRLAAVHRRRDATLAREAMSRDYGRLLAAYENEIAEVRAVTPESPLLATLEEERQALRREADGLYAKALTVWQDGIYQTPFLESFLSNYPQAEVADDVALALGNAYARSRRQAEAVERYLQAAEGGPQGPAGAKALTGLRNLTPVLDDLVALAQLAGEADDEDVRASAAKRLREVAGTYTELSKGATFIKRFPDNELAPAVTKRLESLAQNLYGEVVLYQGIGDHVKALERIQQILEHAPLTPAAEALRRKVLNEEEAG